MLPPGIPSQVEADLQQHALAIWPEEACGVVIGGLYRAMSNLAADRLNDFRLPDTAIIGAEAVLHSHVAGRHSRWPTKSDMQAQIASALPWGIVTTDGETAAPVLWFGDQVLDEPLIGRSFEPGARDCYALARAWWWQVLQVKLVDFPRNDRWWERENLLIESYPSAGFRMVPIADMRAGDLALMSISSKVTNHCAVVLDSGLILHHLGNRLSRREPVGPWRKYIQHVLRHD